MLLAIAIFTGFLIQGNDRDVAAKQTCRMGVEQRQLLADVIGNSQPSVQASIDPTLPESVQQLIRESREQQKQFLEDTQVQMDRPIEICVHAGIESRVRIKNREGVELVPVASVENGTSTTTTTGSASAGPAGPLGPPGPEGPAGPAAPTTTTTTEPAPPPSPPPTEPPLICIRKLCVS